MEYDGERSDLGQMHAIEMNKLWLEQPIGLADESTDGQIQLYPLVSAELAVRVQSTKYKVQRELSCLSEYEYVPPKQSLKIYLVNRDGSRHRHLMPLI